MLTHLRALKDDGTPYDDEFFDLVQKLMLALLPRGALVTGPDWSRTITNVVNMAVKYVAKNGIYGGKKVIGFLQWLTHFGSMVVLDPGKEIRILRTLYI